MLGFLVLPSNLTEDALTYNAATITHKSQFLCLLVPSLLSLSSCFANYTPVSNPTPLPPLSSPPSPISPAQLGMYEAACFVRGGVG